MNSSRTLSLFALLATICALVMQVLFWPEFLGLGFGELTPLVFWILGFTAVFVFGFHFWRDLPQIFYHPTRSSFVALTALLLIVVGCSEQQFWSKFSEPLLWASWVVALSLWIPSLELILKNRWIEVWKTKRATEGLIDSSIENSPATARGSLFMLLGAGLAVAFFWASRSDSWQVGLEAAARFYALCIPFSSRHSSPLIRLSVQIRAFARGIWVRRPEALDRMEEVNQIAFDKTGTLSLGLPKVVRVVSVENISHKEVLQMAASAEQGASHPYAQAIVQEAESEKLSLLPIKNQSLEAGKGVKTQVTREGKEESLIVGNLVWLYEQGLNSSDVPADLLWQAEGSEDTVVWVMRDSQVLGLVLLRDDYRPEAADTVNEIIDCGYDVGLITGDAENVAKRFSKDLGLKFSHAGVMPIEKATVIRRLSEKKKKALDVIYPKVMFIANAEQDVPALREAYLSWGLLARSNWAKEPADFHIFSEGKSLSEIKEGIRVFQDGLQAKSHQSLIEMAYHVVALSWAAGLWTFFSFAWVGNAAISAFIALAVGVLLLLRSVHRIDR
ncbi:MAG: HAD family hydrolase [Bradymonadales bacterium]|nr:MAG: HAD family hydrolase [Bradymonadales bacterium]